VSNFNSIYQELEQGIYQPIYFLHGEEPYYIDQISDYIEKNAIDESLRDFNQSILYGKEISMMQVITEAKKYPMMGERQVVIVKEAQNIKEKELEDLEKYVINPLSSTILVICYKYKKLDKRKKISNLLSKHTVFFESEKIKDYKIADWIVDYVKGKPYKVTPQSCILLSEFLGNDLQKIVNELNKLMITIPQGSEITPAIIEKYIGISKDFNNFELHKALGERNVLKCNQIINYFAANPKNNPPIVTIMSLHSFFTKILLYNYSPDKSEKAIAPVIGVHPFLVKEFATAARFYDIKRTVQAIHYLREYDLKSKGFDSGSLSEGDLLKELIFKLLH
jgi:DNA polymerase III subunit delta